MDNLNIVNYRSISFLESDKKQMEKKKLRTKSFQRDSNIIDLEVSPDGNHHTKKGYSAYFYKDPDDENSIIFDSKYNFIEKYLTLNNLSTNVSDGILQNVKKIPEIFKFDFQVHVRCYNLKGDNFNLFNFVTYKLDGFYDNREFNVERRYKEFLLYRRHLVNNWPGLLIPPIPPKKAFGNMEEGFIKLRKKFLQNFFNKISSAPHLTTTDETRIFLDPSSMNFLEIPDEKFQRSFDLINNFYTEYFGFLINYTLNQEIKKEIEKFAYHLKKSKDTLENFLLITTEAQNNKLECDMEIESLFENLYELDNNYIYEIYKLNKEKRSEYNKDVVECGIVENMHKTKFMDFFNCFYEWANVEFIETDAMIEAILSIGKVKENFEKKFCLLKHEEKYLNKISNPPWLKKIIFSPDYELISQQTQKVELLQKEINSLGNLLDLIYKILFYIEIPLFKTERIQFYNKFLISLNTCSQNEHDKVENIFNHLRDHCLNILKYYNENCVSK